MSDVEPLVFLSAINKFGTQDEGWTLSEGGDESERVFRGLIAFERPFRNAPIVHVGLVGFDISNQGAARVRVRAQNVTDSGFEIEVVSWRETQVYSVEVSWLAVGA